MDVWTIGPRQIQPKPYTIRRWGRVNYPQPGPDRIKGHASGLADFEVADEIIRARNIGDTIEVFDQYGIQIAHSCFVND